MAASATAGIGVLARARGVAIAAAALALAIPASALATPTWQGPVDLSAVGRDGLRPQVAFAPDGAATAVWQRSNGTNTVIQSSSRPAADSWQTPLTVSATGGNATEPQVAVGADGTATAIWIRDDGANTIVQSAIRPAGGSWQAPVGLSATGGDATEPQVAVDADGTATAIWIRDNGTNTIVQSAIRPAGGAWQAPADLSATGQSADVPQVAVDAEGGATAVWRRFDGTANIIQSASRSTGGGWQAPLDLSAGGQDGNLPHVVIGPEGTTIASWYRHSGTATIKAAVRPAGGAWQTATDVSDTWAFAAGVHVVIDAEGDATAVWSRSDGTGDGVQSATRPAGGVWQPAVDLTAAGQRGTDPHVGLDAEGDVTALWTRTDGLYSIVQAATRSAAGVWPAPLELSAGGANVHAPGLAVDTEGNAVAIWSRPNGSHYIVQSSLLDAAGPALDGLSVPSTGTVDESLSFSVSPFDRWSALGATTWTFGDGASATTASATHAYATPGTYTVGLSGTDALGNTTSTTRSIVISAAPAPITPALPPAITPAPIVPVLTNPGQARNLWRLAGPKAKATSRAKVGTAFSFTLNTEATVRFSFAKQLTGRKAGAACKAPTTANRRARPCTRSIDAGSFTRPAVTGSNSVSFAGALSSRSRLTPGTYVLSLSPVASTTAPATLRFTIAG